MFSRLKFILLIFLYLLVGQPALAAAAVQPPEQSYDAVIAEAKKGGYRLIEIDRLQQVYQQAGEGGQLSHGTHLACQADTTGSS
jgi:hypothetical protein